MASFRKRGLNWEVFVAKNGTRKSATFPTKAEAQAWAARTETELQDTRRGIIPNKTFGDLLQRYAEDVSPGKRGARWEMVRIKAYQSDPISKVKLPEIDATDFVVWRDRRLKVVTAGTVLRDWNLLSNACNKAVHEWHWLKENPMSQVKRPAEVPPRDRLLTEAEIEKLMYVLGDDVSTLWGRVGVAMLFALETGMRTAEIANLTWDNVKLEQKHCKVSDGKTRAAKRAVPLSTAAVAILSRFLDKSGLVFNLTPAQIGGVFIKAKNLAGIEGVHFHDTRANAITMLAKKLDILDLARTIGHKDLKMLQVYYRRTAEDIAGDLD